MKSQFFRLALVAVLGLGLSTAVLTESSAQDLFNKKKGGLSDAFSKKNDNKKSSANRSGYDFEKMEKFVLSNKFKDTKKVTELGYRFTYDYKDWTLPTVLEISKSKTNIWVTMVLKRPKIDPLEYPDRLLKLLEWNGTYGDSFFSVIPSTKAITLVGAIQLNGPIEDKDIKEHLDYLGGLAIRTQNLWDTSKWADAPQHVGKWAGEDGNSMKLELTRNGKFVLTSGTGNVTKGNYTLADGTLTMTEATTSGAAGEKVSGKISFSDANHFVLKVGDNELKFVRN